MHAFDWGQFITGCLAVLLLLALGWWLKRRAGAASLGAVTGHSIQIADAVPLGLKHRMVLLHIDDQRVLASIGPTEIRVLHAWKQEVHHAE